MTHFLRELPDAGYFVGQSVPSSLVRNIDEKTRKAFSSTGGTYAPSSPIIIGGAGLELQCGIVIGDAAAVAPGVGQNYVFGDDDYFQFSSPVTRVIDDSPLQLLSNVRTNPRDIRAILTEDDTDTPAMQTRRAGALVRFALRIPNGARLVEVEIGYKIGQVHAGLPQNMPAARVVRIDCDGIDTPYPDQTNLNREPEGWIPTDAAAYFDGLGAFFGDFHTFALTFAPVVRADRSIYDYALEWREESGTGAFADDIGNIISHARLTVLIEDLQPY
jgi:hypothetical protein